MFNTLDIRHQLLFFQPTKGAPASISPTTAADPSHSFRMTINVSCHSEWTQECCVKKKGKRDGDTEWRIYYFDDALPLSLITVTDPSHSFRMTINISLIMTPYRSPHHDTLSFNRHSEWRQECFVRKQESGNMTRSEESMTRMTSLTDSSGHLCPTPFQIYACK